jgi:hypothetical protein
VFEGVELRVWHSPVSIGGGRIGEAEMTRQCS